MNIGRTCRLIEEISKNEVRLTIPKNDAEAHSDLTKYLNKKLDEYMKTFVKIYNKINYIFRSDSNIIKIIEFKRRL